MTTPESTLPAAGSEVGELRTWDSDRDGTMIDNNGLEYDGIERFVLKSDYDSLRAQLAAAISERDAGLMAHAERVVSLCKSFDELAEAVGWSYERLEQSGDSPFDCAKELKQRAETAESALSAQRRECPDGWKLVPIEPTDDMRQALFVAFNPYTQRNASFAVNGWSVALDAYKSMLAAAPSSPQATDTPK